MSLPYYRKHVERWRSSPTVRMMTLLERGAYSELMDLSWQMGPLPDDPSELARLIGSDLQEFEKAWSERLQNCWKKTKKGLINPQLEIERNWAESKTYKSQKAATARWAGGNGHASAMRPHSKRNASASPKHMHIDPDPDPDKDKDKDKRKRKKAPPPPDYRFNPEGFDGFGDFEGSYREHVSKHIQEQYGEEFGDDWIQRTYKNIIRWCKDNPLKISDTKDHNKFVLGWYRRDADKETKGESW